MAEGFRVRVVTPEDVFFDGQVMSLIAPGYLGYLGILQNHAPLVTPLVKGVLTLRLAGGGERKFDVDGGFLEVSRNQSLILVERISETHAQPAAAVI